MDLMEKIDLKLNEANVSGLERNFNDLIKKSKEFNKITSNISKEIEKMEDIVGGTSMISDLDYNRDKSNMSQAIIRYIDAVRTMLIEYKRMQ